eukprot:4961606-Pleurochrysis_carterae.AAC.3
MKGADQPVQLVAAVVGTQASCGMRLECIERRHAPSGGVDVASGEAPWGEVCCSATRSPLRTLTWRGVRIHKLVGVGAACRPCRRGGSSAITNVFGYEVGCRYAGARTGGLG